MKTFTYSIALITLFSVTALAQKQGYYNPKDVEDPIGGCLSCPGMEWNTYDSVMSQDFMSSKVTLYGSKCNMNLCYYSRSLAATNFGFTIPTGADIDGVTARIFRSADVDTCVADSSIYLYVKGAGYIGNNAADFAAKNFWVPNETKYAEYGSANDTWGVKLNPSTVNDQNFGISIKARNTKSTQSPTAMVDHVQLAVYYSLSTGKGLQVANKNISMHLFNDVVNKNLMVNADLKNTTTATVDVYNSLGQLFFSKTINANNGNLQEVIPTSAFAGGVYFVKITSGNEQLTQKVIIQ